MKLPARTGRYSPQVWVLFWGSLISMTGQSLVWPFLTIYIRQQLDVPLAQVTLLFSVQSAASLAATILVGPAVDRFGRKWAMVIAPMLGSAMLLAMTRAETLPLWAVILGLYGASGIVFRLGANAMIADIVPPEQRADTYALMRMAFNVGIAVGPAIGGYLVATSYTLSFVIAAGVQAVLALVVLFAIRESLPERSPEESAVKGDASYLPVLKDRLFMRFWGVYLLVEVAAAIVFSLLALYIKEQYAIPENQFGYILSTNALMVVLFQYAVTRVTRRYAPLPVMAVSAVFYAAGMAIYALGVSFPAFWLGMVVMTIGELILSPTSVTLAANLAPPDKRGRYMGVYGLSYRVGAGVGPPVGGLLSDAIAPNAPWVFGMGSCLLATGGFLLMARSQGPQPANLEEAAEHQP